MSLWEASLLLPSPKYLQFSFCLWNVLQVKTNTLIVTSLFCFFYPHIKHLTVSRCGLRHLGTSVYVICRDNNASLEISSILDSSGVPV